MHMRADVVAELKALGIRDGAAIMVHASLRRVGPIDGGADTLLDSLLEAIGSGGTLVMPLGASPDEPFDALKSPAEKDMGVLPEIFRQRAETEVNDHAACRFGAIGPAAPRLLDNLPLHDYHGSGSLVSRFTEMGGEVLRLGADVDTVTLTHWAEYIADIPSKRRIRTSYLRADIGRQTIEGLDDMNGIAEWNGGDYFSQILIDYVAAKNASVGQIGNCTAEHFRARSFVDFARLWIESNL